MTVLQNSIYAPTPFAIANGGTGNSTALTNGQLWIGNTGNIPTPATITAGANIMVTNGNGSITIAASSTTGPIPWQVSAVGLNMVGNHGYVNVGGSNVYRFPASPTFGDIYSLQGVGYISTITIASGSTQLINYLGTSGTILQTVSEIYSAITLLCINADPLNTLFTVLSTNGAAFSLT